MSLINQMLQDLDARGSEVGGAAAGQGHVRSVPERRTVNPALPIGVAVGVVLIAAAGWFWFSARAPIAAPPAQEIQQARTPETAPVPAFALKLAADLSMVPLPNSQSIGVEDRKARALESELALSAATQQAGKKNGDANPPAEAAKEESRAKAGNTPGLNATDALNAAGTASAIAPASGSRIAMTDPKQLPGKLGADLAGTVTKQITILTPRQQAENEYRQATVLIQQGRAADAIGMLEQALQIDPQNGGARQTLVGLLLDYKRQDDAARRLKEGLALDPNQPGLAMILARLQVDKGQLRPAIETLQRTLPQATDRADYQAFLAALLQREARHREAIDQYGAALRKAPQNGVWWMGIAISFQAENRTAEAVEAFSRAKASNALSPELRAFVEEKLSQLQH